MDQTGQIRRQRRSETDALSHLEEQVHDPNLSGGAVADVLTGAALVRARQRNTQTQLSRSIAEQLLAEAKRDRDTDVAVMNMRFARQPTDEDDFNLATGSAAVIDRFHLP